MSNTSAFLEAVNNGYSFKGEKFKIGRAMLDGQVVDGADVFIPFKTLNRHGLIPEQQEPAKPKPCRYWPRV
ncbi:hypothetical protein KRR40_11995 [Niabella defluvii]|nr:hypothetical protein KRR40_11995 [Niabella sp. I65]